MSRESTSALLPLPGSATYFLRLKEAFDEAAARGAQDHFFRIARLVVQVRCAGGTMADCLQAFEHLRVPPARADLLLCLADSASVHSAPPPMPAWPGRTFQIGDSWHLQEDGNEVWCHQAEHGIGALHGSASIGIYWVSDARVLAQHEFGSPLMRLLHWWFSGRERQVLHAAAIGFPEGGVLLTGPGGVGKSTSAIACLDSSLRYVGDDYCLVSSTGPPTAFSLYNSAKMHWGNPVRSRLGASPSPYKTDEKALYFIHQTCPGKAIDEFPLRAVLVPRATGLRDTQLRPMRAGEAFLAAASSTGMQLSGSERQTYENIGALFRQLPCFRLEAGTDLEQIPQAIIKFLQGG